MHRLALRYRAAWLFVVVAAIVGLVALAPHLGHSTTSAPLWTDRPMPSAPVAAVPQPNWVELTRALKPAVVNISTKRVEERVQFQNPFGNQGPFGTTSSSSSSSSGSASSSRPAAPCAAWARASSSTRPATS